MSTKQQVVEGRKIKQLERRIEYLQRVVSVWKGRYRKVARSRNGQKSSNAIK